MKVLHVTFYGCCFAGLLVSIAAFLVHIIAGFFVLGIVVFILSLVYSEWFDDPKTIKQILTEEDKS